MIWGFERKVAACVMLACALSAPLPARAEPVDDATRASVRKLGDEAKALFDSGDYAAALDRYQRADELLPRVPTIGVRIARCLVRLGRLVEASERYLAVTRLSLPPDAPSVHKEAQEQASREREQLDARIGGVVVRVDGAPDATITLDGRPLPRALLGVKRAIDPGAHHLEARAGDASVTKDFTVKDGEVIDLPIALGAPATSIAPKASAAPAAATAGDRATGSTQRTIGFVTIGAGALGLGVGIAAGAVALGQKSHLTDVCGPQLACGPSDHDAADKYNATRVASSAGFIAGGALAALGIVLVLTAPRGQRVAVTLAPAHAALRGAF